MEENKKKRQWIIVLGVILLCGGLIAFIINANFGSKAEMGSKSGISEEQIKEALKNKVDKNIMAFSMESEVLFKDGNEEGTINIENLPNNNYDIKVEITRDDNKESIYESEKIKPGYILREDKLDTNLKKGSYKCTANIIGYEEGKEKKRVYMSMLITVEE